MRPKGPLFALAVTAGSAPVPKVRSANTLHPKKTRPGIKRGPGKERVGFSWGGVATTYNGPRFGKRKEAGDGLGGLMVRKRQNPTSVQMLPFQIEFMRPGVCFGRTWKKRDTKERREPRYVKTAKSS